MAGLFSKEGLLLFFAKLQLAFTDMQENCSQLGSFSTMAYIGSISLHALFPITSV